LAIGAGVVLLAFAAVALALSAKYLKSSRVEPAAGQTSSRFERSRFYQGLKIVIVSWQIVTQASGID